MAIERLELRGGQWADLRTSPTHKQNHAIVNAAERAAGGKGTYSDWAEQCGVQLLTAWHVNGEDGQPLRIEQWEDCPARSDERHLHPRAGAVGCLVEVGGPFRGHKSAVKRYLIGQAVKVSDPLLGDALFLTAHPGWSPSDLADADEDLVMLMRAIATEKAVIESQRRP